MMMEKRYPFKDLIEKIDFEFYKFKELLLVSSRDNIFAHAAEIVKKTSIRDELYDYPFSLGEKNMIMCQENIIETIYCIIKDDKQSSDDVIKAINEICRKNK